jgi:hypothetical protein
MPAVNEEAPAACGDASAVSVMEWPSWSGSPVPYPLSVAWYRSLASEGQQYPLRRP